MSRGLTVLVVTLSASVTVSAQQGAAEQGTTSGEWRAWGGDLASTRYAPLDQINAGNFNKLEVAWRFKTENLGKIPDFNMQSTPLMVNGVLYFTAGAHRDAVAPRSRANAKGFVRAFDARTGKRRWIFHTIPQPGEFGNDTWLKDSWTYTGHTGLWGQLSVDEELGIAYLPIEMPTGDYFGGHRPGNNLFGESLVAVDLQTGKRIWHFQFVHHPIWDYDVPCPPLLADITVGGKT